MQCGSEGWKSALEVPMTFDQKLDFFRFLVDMGFKEIEVGFRRRPIRSIVFAVP